MPANGRRDLIQRLKVKLQQQCYALPYALEKSENGTNEELSKLQILWDQHIRLTESQIMSYMLTENKQKNLLFCVIVQRDRKSETPGSNPR